MEQLDKTNNPTPVGQILQYLISYRDTNVFALAKKTGIPQPTILKIIRGLTKNPGIYTIEKLAEGLDISPSIFFEDSFNSNKEDFEGICKIVSDFRSTNPQLSSNTGVPLYTWEDVRINPEDCITRNNKKVLGWFNYPLKKANSNIFCLKIESDLYLPVFNKEDLIFVDPDRLYEQESILLIRKQHQTIDEDQVYRLYISQEIKEPDFIEPEFSLDFKKISFNNTNEPFFTSLNPYPNYQIREKIDDSLAIIGVVVGKFSTYR